MTVLAIGQVVVDGRVSGTAFAVSPELLVTCRHCVVVASSTAGTVADEVEVRFPDTPPVQATVLQHVADADLALLGVRGGALPPELAPLVLGRDIDAGRSSAVEAIGWPRDNPSTAAPQALTGHVDQPVASIGAGARVLRVGVDTGRGRAAPARFQRVAGPRADTERARRRRRAALDAGGRRRGTRGRWCGLRHPRLRPDHDVAVPPDAGSRARARGRHAGPVPGGDRGLPQRADPGSRW